MNDRKSASLIAAIAGVAFILWYRSRSEAQRDALTRSTSGLKPENTTPTGLIPAPVDPRIPDFNSPSAAKSWQSFLETHPGYLGSARR